MTLYVVQRLIPTTEPFFAFQTVHTTLESAKASFMLGGEGAWERSIYGPSSIHTFTEKNVGWVWEVIETELRF